MRTFPVLLGCVAAAALAIPAPAGAVGLPDGYPRTIAGVGLGDSVRVTRTQAQFKLLDGNRVQINVYGTATALRTGRKLVVVAARCKGSASSPTCVAAASSRITLPASRLNVQRTFRIARPASPPDALRVMLMVTRTSSAPVPLCSAGTRPGAACRGDSRFVLAGDLLLANGTWRHNLGTRHGTEVTAEGIDVDQVFFNSRTYAWTATPSADGTARTTIGYPNQPPARTFDDALRAGVRKAFDRTPSVGTAFETRAGVRTLRYGTAVGEQTMFRMSVPVPRWTNNG
jgi:hypothetical protein